MLFHIFIYICMAKYTSKTLKTVLLDELNAFIVNCYD